METGGGDTNGHGMVLVLHMMKQFKSSRKLTELFTRKYDSICSWLHCLKPFHEQFTVSICVCVSEDRAAFACTIALIPSLVVLHYVYSDILLLTDHSPTELLGTKGRGVHATPPSLHASWCREYRARCTAPTCEESDGGCA